MKTKRIILIFLAFCYFHFWALGSGFSLPFNKAGGSYAFKIVDVVSSKVIADYNSEMLLIPASVTKLFTTATALDLHGSDYRFKTSLYIRGEVLNGVLRGDLIVRGNGDPTFGSVHFPNTTPEKLFSEWANVLLAMGIKSITGGVVIDNSLYGSEVIPTKWLWEDMGNYYAAGVWCVNIFDNKYTLELESGNIGSRPLIKSVTPNIESLVFDNSLVAASNSKDSAYIYGVPMDNHRKIYGTIPANRKNFKISGDIPNPAKLFGDILSSTLINHGIKVDQDVEVVYDTATLRGVNLDILHTHYSPKLSEICRVVNVVSNNLFADALLRLIAQKGNTVAIYQSGIANLKRYWFDRGVDLSRVVLYDGSGLSPCNRFSPESLVELLRYMYNQSTSSSSFMSSLPIGGTQRLEFKGTPLEGRVYLKSGTMGGVRCYGGYVKGNNGKSYAFVFMANDPLVSTIEMRRRFEAILSQQLINL
ncbi:MAG: D-alanyl-D-alanine carboxypeptidase/D-alanyl-D-alanine endopeptidase [Bacteroidales bacterium]